MGESRIPALSCTVTGTTVVLNGPSSSGKTTLGLALQRIWPRALLVTGIDSLLAGLPLDFFTVEDSADLPHHCGRGIRPGDRPRAAHP